MMIKMNTQYKLIILAISMLLFANAMLIYANAEEEESLDKKYCADYSGKWNDNKEKCEIEDEEERTYL